MVPQKHFRLTTSGVVWRRLAWLLCVGVAVGLFTWQVYDRCRVFIAHNTTISVTSRYETSVPFPAVTLCNANTFRYVKLRESRSSRETT